MSIVLRVLLIIFALFFVIHIFWRIRRAHVLLADALFWVAFSLFLLLLSVFPQIAIVAAKSIGIISTANFVFLILLFAGLVKLFSLSVEMSIQKVHLTQLIKTCAVHNMADTTDNNKGE